MRVAQGPSRLQMVPTIDPGVGRGERALGAGLAAAIALIAAVVLAGAAEANLFDEGLEGILALCSLGAAIGVPVGALLGWIHMPAAASNDLSGRLLLVARLATLSVMLGAAVLSIGIASGGPLIGGADVMTLGSAAASFVLLFAMGLIIFGVPGWALAAAVCSIWVLVVAEIYGHGRPTNRQAAT